MRCWWCGVEPEALHDVTALSDPEPQYLPTWPSGGDHEHAERQPSPGGLAEHGDRAAARILAIAAE